MTLEVEKETWGAWVIHHGRKVIYDINGSAAFPAIDVGAKAATLLAKIGQTNEAEIPKSRLKAIAQAANISPVLELNGILSILERRRLIEQSENNIVVLGVTTRGSLRQAYDIFLEAKPSLHEHASLTLAEMTSHEPIKRSYAFEYISDNFKLSHDNTDDFLKKAEAIGFVDKEEDGTDALLFNGNLFRKDNVSKTKKVLSSLSNTEAEAVNYISDRLSKQGCLDYEFVETALTSQLFQKLIAAGLYDLNGISNGQGEHVYVTSPAAFHKFVDPMIDDCFNMAKCLVAALTYGMKKRTTREGRINDLSKLVQKLIDGREVGPTTSIGQDYRVLETNGVVQIREDEIHENRFYLKLLKREVGELALQVLTQGDANSVALIETPNVSMRDYIDPEVNRTAARKRQDKISKIHTRDILQALRSGGTF